MIGFLCSENREETVLRVLSTTLKPMLARADEKALFFTLANVNLEEKRIYGTKLENFTAIKGVFPLPSMVVNLSKQRRYADVKKMRALAELPGTRIFNAVNRYNQRAVTSMLMSDSTAAKLILPSEPFRLSANTRKSLRRFPPNFFLRPENSTDRTKILYCRNHDSKIEIFNPQGISYEPQNFLAYVKTVQGNEKWLLQKAPELLLTKNRFCTARIWAQRLPEGEWSPIFDSFEKSCVSLQKTTEEKIIVVLQSIAECIHCYIPTILFCFVDLAFDSNGNPFFLGFGGWQDSIILQKDEPEAKERICRNILAMKQQFPD